jgi:hypothetical protein
LVLPETDHSARQPAANNNSAKRFLIMSTCPRAAGARCVRLKRASREDSETLHGPIEREQPEQMPDQPLDQIAVRA